MVMIPTGTDAVAGGQSITPPQPVSYGTNPSTSGTSGVDPAAALAQQWSYLTGLTDVPPASQTTPQNLTAPAAPTQNSFAPMRIQ